MHSAHPGAKRWFCRVQIFLTLWAIVPLMIIKGRVDEEPKIKTSPKVKAKKKGWFN